MNRITAAGFCAVVVCANLFAQKEPAWVKSPSSVFPEQQYLAAVGGGKTRQAAENAAKGGMAAFFKQSISSTIVIVDTETQTNAGSSAKSDYSQTTESSAALDSLIGVEIRETWNDTKGKTGWWAIAVMEKARGRERYTSELNKNVSDINRLIAGADDASLETVKKCVEARAKVLDAEMYALILSLLDGPNRQPELSVLAAKVDKALAAARTVTVDVRVTGDIRNSIKASFLAAFTGLGINTGGQNSRYALEVTFSLQAADRDRYYNTDYTVDAVLTDAKTGTELFAYNTTDRASNSRSQAEANDRALIRAVEAIEEEFPELLQEYLSSN